MYPKISVVINTLNEVKNIERAIRSVVFADEIVVVDDGSTDGTLQVLMKSKIAKDKLQVYQHKSVGYVEPARNFAISKASNEWILVLDADEIIPESLAERLIEIASTMKKIDYVRLPRKNIIFGHFMKASMWWPDYNIRFFKKGNVKWDDQIHRPPETSGEGLDLTADERYAIVHHNYDKISQFLGRMDRYTTIQAEELKKEGYKFNWKDLFEKPLSEFLSRYFAGRGYEDGLHGLALSLLQAISFFVVYLKLWEIDKFREQSIELKEIKDQSQKASESLDYWFKQSRRPVDFLKRFFGGI